MQDGELVLSYSHSERCHRTQNDKGGKIFPRGCCGRQQWLCHAFVTVVVSRTPAHVSLLPPSSKLKWHTRHPAKFGG